MREKELSLSFGSGPSSGSNTRSMRCWFSIFVQRMSEASCVARFSGQAAHFGLRRRVYIAAARNHAGRHPLLRPVRPNAQRPPGIEMSEPPRRSGSSAPWSRSIAHSPALQERSSCYRRSVCRAESARLPRLRGVSGGGSSGTTGVFSLPSSISSLAFAEAEGSPIGLPDH
jgi:hypothetical protein